MGLSRTEHKSLCREAASTPETGTLLTGGDPGEGKTCLIPNKTAQKGHKTNADGKLF